MLHDRFLHHSGKASPINLCIESEKMRFSNIQYCPPAISSCQLEKAPRHPSFSSRSANQETKSDNSKENSVYVERNGRKPRVRTFFTSDQLRNLEKAFSENAYPDVKMRAEICSRLKLRESQVLIWFQNKRARNKKLKQKVDLVASINDKENINIFSKNVSLKTEPLEKNVSVPYQESINVSDCNLLPKAHQGYASNSPPEEYSLDLHQEFPSSVSISPENFRLKTEIPSNFSVPYQDSASSISTSPDNLALKTETSDDLSNLYQQSASPQQFISNPSTAHITPFHSLQSYNIVDAYSPLYFAPLNCFGPLTPYQYIPPFYGFPHTSENSSSYKFTNL